MTISRTLLTNRVEGLIGTLGGFYDALTNSPTGSGTSYTVADGTKWARGDIAETDDGDLARVTLVAGNSLTVVRGFAGAANVAHTTGDTLRKNPPVYRKDLFDAIQLTMQSLWPMAWKVSSTTVTPNLTKEW